MKLEKRIKRKINKSQFADYLFFILFRIHILIADDKLVSGVRFESISVIIDAIDLFSAFAISCKHSMNSDSIEILV